MYGCQVARHNPKNLFLLTNPDKYANISQNINKELMIPGAGCIGAFFQAFCDRQPDECPGKPNPTFLNTLLTTLRVSP
jgi:ribonucleotide monophosphatase NagD (HAD superfamily)